MITYLAIGLLAMASSSLLVRAGFNAAPEQSIGISLTLALLAVGFVAANLALQYGAARLPARVTAVVMLSEVVFAAGSAVWLGGEVLTAQLVLGATLIIGTSLISALQPR